MLFPVENSALPSPRTPLPNERHIMISAVEFSHEFLDGEYLDVRYMHRLSEVSIEYTAMDGHIEVEDFGFKSGSDLRDKVIDIVRRMGRSASERADVRDGIRELLDLVDQVHAS